MNEIRRSPIPLLQSILTCPAAALIGTVLCALFLFDFDAVAQTADRVITAVDEQRTVTLAGNRHPDAIPRFDIGPADPDLPMKRMILVLQPGAAAQSSLAAFAEAQNDPNSPQYHQWLTPEGYAERFGVSSNDIGRVSEWLLGHGFQIDEVPGGRQSIIFSGSVAEVESAFHTSIRKYRVAGEDHVANASDPEIPEALAGVVAGAVSLHNFPRQALHHGLAPAPQYTNGGAHYLGPADFATIYDVNALYSGGTNGTGETIGIVGRINIRTVDIESFRETFLLPLNNPMIVLNGPDPGIWSDGEEAEADLDVEWSGAVAPLAAVKFVVSASTNTTDGVDLSAQYIVGNNLASVMSTSFGSCEAAMGAADRAFYSNLWQQAAAQGITAFVASGDEGAAGCDYGGDTTAVYGQAVNGLCSSVSSVCVGGTEFNENGNNNLYWSATNNASLGSALSYIPEVAWNESGTMSGGSGLWATGGGPSAYYSKPAWQAGPGVPADGKRDVPDVSLSAAGHDGYLVVILGDYYIISGTSAASPSMAGLMALVDQKNGGRQGNANTKFYPLATYAASGGAAIFRGTTGGNNSVPGQIGFTANLDYNQATGLGSADAFVMASHWTETAPAAPSFTLTPSATALTVVPGGHGSVTATVAVSGGFSSVVTLTASGAPGGVTVAYATTPLTAPGSGGSVLTVTASSSAALGSFALTLTAAGGGVTKTAAVNVTIAPPFTLTANAASITIHQGASGSLGIATSANPGFGAAVALTATSHSGVTATFTPSTIASPGAGSSSLNLAAASNAATGTYTLTIAGTSGSTVKSTTVSVTIATPPSFALSLPTSTLSIPPNGSGSIQVNVVANAGFNSTVTFSTGVLPSGISVNFSGATMTVKAMSSAALGSHSITINGTSGGISATAVTLTLTVGTFALSVPSSVTVLRGRSANVAIHTSVTNGYNVPVTLSVAGLLSKEAASFSPATIPIPASGSSTLTLSVAPAMTPGSYTMNLVASSGGAVVIAPLLVLVQ